METSACSPRHLGRVIQQHVGKIKPKADIRAAGGALYEQDGDGNWQQVVAPKPVPGRDVPYSADVESQQKRIHAQERQLPGRDIPYSPAVEDQYNRMHPNSTGSPSGATLAAIENRKGDALMRIEKDPTLTDDEREQYKQAVQDNYENQLRAVGSPVPHFSYSTQRLAGRTAVGKNVARSSIRNGAWRDPNNEEAVRSMGSVAKIDSSLTETALVDASIYATSTPSGDTNLSTSGLSPRPRRNSCDQYAARRRLMFPVTMPCRLGLFHRHRRRDSSSD